MQSAAVKLQADDGEHEDCKKQQQANLQQRNHGLHDRLQDYLQTWNTEFMENTLLLNKRNMHVMQINSS